MPLSAYAKDNFIAPGMSTFTSACIRDMAGTSVEQEHWLNNYVLNTLFRVKLDEQVRQSLFNFLRRSQFAFREYALAREQTASYLRSVDAVSTYFVAIGHWEVFLAYAYQAFELLAGRRSGPSDYAGEAADPLSGDRWHRRRGGRRRRQALRAAPARSAHVEGQRAASA